MGRCALGVASGGLSWFPVTDSLPSLSVAAIAIDPTNPNRVYIAITNVGIYRSDDAGLSWALVSADTNAQAVHRNSQEGDLTVLLVDPNEPATLYLTTNVGVLRSENSGAAWQTSLPGVATAVVMDPFNSKKLYAAIQGQGVYKTTDGGALGNSSWTPQPLPNTSNFSPVHGIRLALDHPPVNLHEIVYALVGSETDRNGTATRCSVRRTEVRCGTADTDATRIPVRPVNANSG